MKVTKVVVVGIRIFLVRIFYFYFIFTLKYSISYFMNSNIATYIYLFDWNFGSTIFLFQVKWFPEVLSCWSRRQAWSSPSRGTTSNGQWSDRRSSGDDSGPTFATPKWQSATTLAALVTCRTHWLRPRRPRWRSNPENFPWSGSCRQRWPWWSRRRRAWKRPTRGRWIPSKRQVAISKVNP